MEYSQDELAQLFAQRMTFDPAEALTHTQMKDEKQAIPPSDVATEPSQSPPPSYNESLMPEAMAQIFRRNSIDPASLLPNQIELFTNAQDEQRLRLIELWRISPPSYLPKEEHVYLSWAPTSMQQEEQLAKVRFETTMALRAHQAYHASVPESAMQVAPSDFDTHVAVTVPKVTSEAEPYIVSGYQSGRSDPAYAASPALWQSPAYAHANRESMEDQYGAMMQIRNHADWEAMNQRLASERLAATGGRGYQDDDMEL